MHGLLKFYRTPTRLASRTHEPSVSVVGEKPFLMVPTDSSYAVFGLQSLNLQFLSSSFPKIDYILQSGVFVYVCCRQTVYKTYRGEAVSEFVLASEATIRQVVMFGSYFAICCGDSLVVCECCDDIVQEDSACDRGSFLKELYRLDYTKEVLRVFHPHAYLNKILIIFGDGTADLYNLNSQKTIFKFDLGPVACICQTSVVDTVVLGMTDGTVRIFNLKKNKVVLDIEDYKGESIRRVDSKNNFLMVVSEDAIIYDLDIKKEIYRRSSAFSGLIVNATMALVTTGSDIEIITLSDLKVLKSRKILNRDIKSIESLSDTEMVLASGDRIYKMCIYRDEASTFLKTSSSVDLVSADTHILVYGDRKLTYIDREGRLRNFLHTRCTFVRTFREFCMIGKSSGILIMNMKSKRVVLRMEMENPVDGDLDNETFTVLQPSGIFTYSYASELLYQYSVTGDGVGIRKIGNIYFLQMPRTVQIISQKLCREFEGTRYSVDPAARIMAAVSGSRILLYDIVSGNTLDCLKTNKAMVGIAILDNLKFVGALDSESHVHLLSNISHFNAIHNSSAVTKLSIPPSIQVMQKSSTLYRDLLMYKDTQSKTDPDMVLKGMTRSEVSELIQIIKKNITTDFFGTQNVLNKVLLFKGRLISVDDLREISEIVRQKLDEFEKKVLKTVGYLRLEKNKLL